MSPTLDSVLGWFRRGGATPLIPAAATQKPLLDPQELGELALRLQHAPRPSLSPREVAHRRLGESRSVYRGSGMDYDESRPYQSGDDPRAMDWRLTARAGEPYLKLYREERRPATFILVDRRAAMRFGTKRRLKVTQAARVAALAAFDARRRQSAVAGLLLESPPQWLAESAAVASAFRFATAAARPAPPLLEVSEPPLHEALSQLVPLLVRGSTLWLISDFHDLTPVCSGLLLKLASEHSLRAVQVIDPAEQALPAAGALQLHAVDGGAPVEVDSDDPLSRVRFAEAAAATLTRRSEQFASLNIPCIRLLTDSEELERELPL